ncbi:MAG: transposase [Dehalococcoidia bacterium]
MRDHTDLFGGLPERPRLPGAQRTHHRWTDGFLVDATFSTVIDIYGIELIHPWRAGRKGYSSHRWIVGLKLCWIINDRGEVVAWDWHTANVHDQTFASLAGRIDGLTLTLAGTGFHAAAGDPPKLKICPLLHRVCRLTTSGIAPARIWPCISPMSPRTSTSCCSPAASTPTARPTPGPTSPSSPYKLAPVVT